MRTIMIAIMVIAAYTMSAQTALSNHFLTILNNKPFLKSEGVIPVSELIHVLEVTQPDVAAELKQFSEADIIVYAFAMPPQPYKINTTLTNGKVTRIDTLYDKGELSSTRAHNWLIFGDSDSLIISQPGTHSESSTAGKIFLVYYKKDMAPSGIEERQIKKFPGIILALPENSGGADLTAHYLVAFEPPTYYCKAQYPFTLEIWDAGTVDGDQIMVNGQLVALSKVKHVVTITSPLKMKVLSEGKEGKCSMVCRIRETNEQFPMEGTLGTFLVVKPKTQGLGSR